MNAIVMVVVTVIVPGAGAVSPLSPEVELGEPEIPKPEVSAVQVVVTEDTLGSLSQVWDALFALMLGSLRARRQVKRVGWKKCRYIQILKESSKLRVDMEAWVVLIHGLSGSKR